MENTFEEHIIVKNSHIHGYGIFTTTFIPANSKIMVIEGDVISGEECERRENEEHNVYIFWNGDNYIDTINSEKIKYINHLCECNCEIHDKDERSLWLVASRNISAGEELSIDYGYDEIYENCHCTFCEEKVESTQN